MSAPAPFEIVVQDGVQVASNGLMRLALLDAEGSVFKRRGMSGLSPKPAAEGVLPQINQLAGELLTQLDMPAQDVVNRLMSIAGTVHVTPPQKVEWAVAELDGVRVYVDGVNVIVTRADLTP